MTGFLTGRKMLHEALHQSLIMRIPFKRLRPTLCPKKTGNGKYP